MDDVASAHTENDHLRKIRTRLLQWESKDNPLAALSQQQQDYLDELTNAWQDEELNELHKTTSTPLPIATSCTKTNIIENSEGGSKSLQELWQSEPIETTKDFLLWYEKVREEMQAHEDAAAHSYLAQLELRNNECQSMLEQVAMTMERLDKLSEEYEFVSQKTSALNNASEQLIEEQEKLQNIADEIKRRLHYFNQVEMLQQRLQSPTLSVASEAFRDCMNRIDECLQYLRENPNFKDSAAYTVKYKHCLARAVTLMKNYTSSVMRQATDATLNHPKQIATNSEASGKQTITTKMNLPDAAFALYYGKYQMSAAKIKRVTALVEARLDHAVEYEQLLVEMQQTYLTERSVLMSPAVSKAIQDLKIAHKNDHCSLMRSTCSFLVHVCQDEQRLYFQFFSQLSEQLTAYLEGLCTVLYDTMRPYIIHINHLETLAEICSILRIEMLEENVQQNPEALEAFASTVNQLLQDVQERLVFRAHLYLQSDILNYNPSAGDLAYPDKLEMMESIALSLQEPQHMRRFDSHASLVSSVSSAVETESVDTNYRMRNMNSPADLHGMWYPTVRRTLVCLSRLYRCVDRPIFQGLSQEALKLCIQSVSSAALKIAVSKSPIDGELFEIKHLLILREQIAPFRVDFTIKETSLDFSKVKTAAFGLLQKRKQLFSMNSNNALLEFLLDGTPQIKEHLLDSRKEVDRQLKSVCEHFIKDAVHMLVGPIVIFLEKAQNLLNSSTGYERNNNKDNKINYALRQSVWASPQQISSNIQETQRLIKAKLPALQRSMQLYLSNRDTEFIIFRPIRNNIIQAFAKLENILSTNGYTSDDMTIAGCPSAEQISILLSSASILAAEGVVNFAAAAAMRKLSTSSNEGGSALTAAAVQNRKISQDKLRYGPPESASSSNSQPMEHVPELPESCSSATSPSSVSPLPTPTSHEPQQPLTKLEDSTQHFKDAN